jgi:hypothetical protein
VIEKFGPHMIEHYLRAREYNFVIADEGSYLVDCLPSPTVEPDTGSAFT